MDVATAVYAVRFAAQVINRALKGPQQPPSSSRSCWTNATQ
jgi:hypothetical protein